MPRDSGGVYTLPVGYLAVTGTVIQAPQHNNPLEDIAASLTGSLPRNGSAGMLADLPMGTKKITGMADGTAASHAVTKAQLDAQGPDAAQTLTNKILRLPQIDDTTADHQYVFAVSELTADRTVTLPLLTANDTFVFANHPQTLGDKTLTNPVSRAFAGQLFGLTLSNGSDATNDINIAVGSAASDAAVAVSMALTSALTKRLDATWGVGTNQGGRMSAAAIADTTYHVWLIRRSDTGVVDVGFDVSATAPTMPANYDQKRRIGSIIRDSGAIRAFTQRGDRFLTAIQTDRNTSTPVASSLLALSVPLGIEVEPMINARLSTNSTGVGSLLIGSAVTGSANIPVAAAADQFANDTNTLTDGIITNTSAQIYVAHSTGAGSSTSTLETFGWTDRRGRDA